MIKLIQTFFSNKRNLTIMAILAVIVIAIAVYVLTSIQNNVQKMAQTSGEIEIFPLEYPTLNLTGLPPERIQQIKRGEYLTKAGDCIACHTNSLKKGTPFAGGLPMETPFGTIFSPNITPDKETGIGNWTDEQFMKAMREGISPKGKHYYPAFPYLYFNKITTDDLKAIKAYFDSIPPVHEKNLANTMVWPFNWRFLQSGWRMLFFHPAKTGAFQEDPKESKEWNRGAYLVEGLGHCAMCHTPSYYLISEKYPLGAPMMKYNLTGSKIQGYLAPNISKMNIFTVSDDEFLKVFTHNRLIGGGNVEGPMLEANQNSLKYLTKSDLLAIINYLKSVDSKMPPKPKAGKGGPGKAIYESYCEGCHATGGGGAPKYADVAAWEPLLKNGITDVYTHAIQGIAGMPAKGTCFSCSDDEIKQTVDYMVSAVSGKTNRLPPPVKKLTLDDGKKIYEKNCSVCHDSGFQNAPKPGDKETWKPIISEGFIITYLNVLTGSEKHPPNGGCLKCTDADIKAAVKYMMTESSNKDYSLW